MNGQSSTSRAKNQLDKEKPIGHVWTNIKIPGRADVLVDTTFMGRGDAGENDRRLTAMSQKQALRHKQMGNETYPYQMRYFDFSYKKLQKKGEYRFSLDKTVLK